MSVRCRYPKCTEGPFTGAPSARVMCRSRCSIIYHSTCWLEVRKEVLGGKGRDKDCLGRPCTTPDCGGTIARCLDTAHLEKSYKLQQLFYINHGSS